MIPMEVVVKKGESPLGRGGCRGEGDGSAAHSNPPCTTDSLETIKDRITSWWDDVSSLELSSLWEITVGGKAKWGPCKSECTQIEVQITHFPARLLNF